MQTNKEWRPSAANSLLDRPLHYYHFYPPTYFTSTRIGGGVSFHRSTHLPKLAFSQFLLESQQFPGEFFHRHVFSWEQVHGDSRHWVGVAACHSLEVHYVGFRIVGHALRSIGLGWLHNPTAAWEDTGTDSGPQGQLWGYLQEGLSEGIASIRPHGSLTHFIVTALGPVALPLNTFLLDFRM